MKLTPKQKAFADYYIQLGNATEAAIKAGYSKRTARFIGNENLTKPYIKDYIEERNKTIESKRIADMKEVKEFWTNVLRDEEVETKDRLKASEYIAKTSGAFLDKVEHSGNVSNEVNITIDGEEYGT
ncbi:terminase small subunit [Clostridium botulinum]|uniref:Terminase n=1 Tax=Clostridium botulinum C/D str. DC5 TaxID=1443128 RepID=A0A0A0IIA1_CLOBO|nr:terminase small subunit [Clostridium botulinum]MCD3234601.1 terminase small subunit [Clostridium botulinum D/C]KGN00324.1 terminase [Clostridium botulinum C/D str. DC5]KOC51329.1 terminase [Clostridium botulinum]KOC53693.1 terminase [Clostridium botulinum]MCD3239744.1 terminase small subunit [Clostridium botulinum D/C]